MMMGGTLAGLEQALTESINAFNNRNMGAVRALLAENATIISIRPRETFHGANPCKASIQKQFADQANFDLLDKAIDQHGAADGAMTRATITGKASWTDRFGPADGETIQYTFECVFDSVRGWLFKEVSAFVVGA
jgi:hypothetical protein